MITAKTFCKVLSDYPMSSVFKITDPVSSSYTKVNDEFFETDTEHGEIVKIKLNSGGDSSGTKRKASTLLAEVTRPNVGSFLNFIKTGYREDYATVKEYKVWRDVYDIKNRTLKKMNDDFSADIMVSEISGACRKCKFLFPLKNLTVDHQKPKKGSGLLPLIRIFRGLGLTIDGPNEGSKNRLAFDKFAKKIGGDHRLGNGTSESADKLKLNNQGKIYFSMIVALNQLEEFNEFCLHHYLNLRPMCNSCNSSLRNRNV